MIITILCGGEGTRSSEITGDIPKHLHPVPTMPALGHILNFVDSLDADIRIVVNPKHRDKFSQYCGMSKRYTIVEQPEPLGEANAVLQAIADLRYSKTPLFVVLGDNIPIGQGADELREILSDADNVESNFIGIHQKRDIRSTTLIKTKNSSEWVPQSNDVAEFVEVRGESCVQGLNLVRSGFDFIYRSDKLYHAIRWLHVYDLKLHGEYRLTTAYQHMLNNGAVFQTIPVDFLSVGDPCRIQQTIDYFKEND